MPLLRYDHLHYRFVLLTLLTLLVVIYRLLICASGGVRAFLLKTRYRRIRTDCIDIVMEKSHCGDWFLLYLLGQNIEPVIFKEVVQELAKKLGYRSKDSGGGEA